MEAKKIVGGAILGALSAFMIASSKVASGEVANPSGYYLSLISAGAVAGGMMGWMF